MQNSNVIFYGYAEFPNFRNEMNKSKRNENDGTSGQFQNREKSKKSLTQKFAHKITEIWDGNNPQKLSRKIGRSVPCMYLIYVYIYSRARQYI